MYDEQTDDYLNDERYWPYGSWMQIFTLLAFIMRG